MAAAEFSSLRRGFWVAFCAFTAWKIVAAWKLTLCFDEPYYHYWSLHPQLSYFDHPPLTGWLMTLSGAVFGGSIWTVRIWPLLLSSLAVLLVRRTAREMFDSTTGDRGGIFMLLAPVFAGNGIVMTPDALLVFFWVAAVYCAWRALAAPAPISLWWIAVGVAAGLGFLSKYNMVLFFAGLTLLFILHAPDRKRIFIGGLISGFIAALIFSPVIVWNLRNDFASFRFQFTHRFAQPPRSVWANVGEYIGILLVIVTPALGALAVWCSGRGVLSADRRMKFCAVFFWSVVAAFGYSALKVHIQANWPMMAFASALILAAFEFPRYPEWLRATVWSVLLGVDTVICAYAFVPAQTPLSFAGYSLDNPRIREFTITPEIAAAIRAKKLEHNLDFVCTSTHEYFGIVSFYAPDLRDQLWLPNAGRIRFPWLDDHAFAGKSALLVSDRKEWGRAPYFESVEAAGAVDIPYKNKKLTLCFWKARNYVPARLETVSPATSTPAPQ